MREQSIPVDLFNPGQVFACIGFLEVADVLLNDAVGGFDWSDEGDVRFCLQSSGEENPFEVALRCVCDAEVNWLSPSAAIRERDGGNTLLELGVSGSLRPSAADLPAEMVATRGGVSHHIRFGYWSDGSTRFSTTFKKSTNGASAHVRFRNGILAIREIIERSDLDAVSRPFHISSRTQSLFRLDPRGSADPLTAGFSADRLRKGGIEMRFATYPICEVFAVIGLEHARPAREDRGRFRYHVWGKNNASTERALLPPMLARAALGQRLSFAESRAFIVEHQEVKRGGDREIIAVREEPNS